MNNDLPVILLKGLCLLPFQEVKLELNNDISKKVINLSKESYSSRVLIVSPLNTLEENPDVSDLPLVGVEGFIKSKIDLLNGNTRVIIEGIKRIEVTSYLNHKRDSNILEAVIKDININKKQNIESIAMSRKLKKLVNSYIEFNNYVSNSVLGLIKEEEDLDKLTDVIANFMNFPFDKKINLMLEIDPILRATELIKELNIEIKLAEYDEELELTLEEAMNQNQKEYILREKVKLIQNELGEDDFKKDDINRYREALLNESLPAKIKEKITKEIRRYELTSEASQELTMIRTYIESLLNIPWGIYTEDETDLNKIITALDKKHYGLIDVKNRILEYIAIKKRTTNASSPIICLVGPPGTGKTSFAESIAESLNRKFVKISLGGLSDSTELIGHRRTYIGSSPGKIISSIIKSGSMNPLLLLDEVDKLYKDYRGDPAATLLDILDKNQNQKFTDNYIEEEVDLSKVFFVLTANDKSNIPSALYDRLEIIDISGYTELEKIDIAKKYLLKRSLVNSGFSTSDIKIDSKTLATLIRSYTRESGVRELDRIINKLIGKIAVEEANNHILPISIKDKHLSEFLGVEKYSKVVNRNDENTGLCKALAYTTYGGTVIDVEVTMYEGHGKMIYTGSLGKVINESAEIALSYIKSNSEEFGIDLSVFNQKDIHINFREAGIPKDGTSAGTVIVTSLISLLTKKSIKGNIALTGEITLNGDVLAVGGLKEKCLAALRYNIKTIYIPFDNRNDIDNLDEEIKGKLNFIFVKNYKEVYESLFK